MDIRAKLKAHLPGRAEATLDQYANCIRRLKQWGFDLSKVEKTFKSLEGSDNTIRTYLCAIMGYLGSANPLTDQYRELMLEKTYEIQDAYEECPLNERQQANWMTWDELCQLRDRLAATADKDIQSNYKHLLMCLYTMIPPLRNDFNALRVVKTLPKDASENYYVRSQSAALIVLNKHKNAKTMPGATIAIPPALAAIINRSLDLFHRLYVISQPRDMNKPVSKTHYNQLIAGIDKSRRLGATMFRKIAKTEWSQRNEGNDHLLAKAMLHKVESAELFYNNNRQSKPNSMGLSL